MASNRQPFLSRSATFVEPHILDSTFLDDIKEDVEKLNNDYKSVKATLSDAEKKQLTNEAERVRVEKLKVVSCEIEDALDVWNTVLLKKQISGAANTTGSNPYPLSDCSWLKQLDKKGDFPSRIRKLNELLDPYNKSEHVAAASEPPQRRISASFIKASTVCGRDLEIQRLVGDLCNSSGQRKGDLGVISVVGMGGVGKTTLAQRVYNDATVKSHFQKMVWVCVSDPFDVLQVAKSIAISLRGNSSDVLQNILECINKSIAGERFMFVLDDVWTEDPSNWDSLLSSLDSGAEGSKILVTTRNTQCARAIRSSSVHQLGQLSPEESWKLFSQIAFFDRSEEDVENLKEVGQKIAQKCKGLPLALKAIASHLLFKSTKRQWERVLESEIWELETAEKGIFKPLLLSYYELPSPIKKCFSFCAVFPKDYKFRVEELIRMWMSQGYLNTSRRNEEGMERVGEEYFQHLLTRSFFQDLEFQGDKISSCKMHDIVHDFAQFLSKDESLIIDIATENNKKPAAGLSSSSCEKVRHLTVLNAKTSWVDVMSSSFSSSIQQKLLHLHTLRIRRRSYIMNSLQNLSQHLCFVKALDLSDNGIVEVPEEIGQLVHLRYLDLSENRKLERLPGTIYELCNLQTLLLNGCDELRELPEEGIEKLINLRYLDLSRNEKLERLPGTIYELCNLQTLLLNWCGALRELPEEGMEKLINLRYLDLSRNKKLERLPGTIYELCNLQTLLLYGCDELRELPEEGIEKLKNLRYLDLSSNRKLERLPGTIYELCNLQTLLLNCCFELRELPEEGIEKLINLRHLEILADMVLPKGIGSLSSLRTLNYFNVCRDDGGEVGATIGDLGNLNNLQGSLKLRGLRYVKDGREASKAELRNKKGLTGLGLHFWDSFSSPGNKEEEVIEALEPPSHSLEELDISGYSGKVLPRWISSSLSKLRVLRLSNLRECEELPPSIGQLPCLETLEIDEMGSCKRIGEEFLGIKRTITGAGGGGSDDGTKMTTLSSVAAVAFPKLKTLRFAACLEKLEIRGMDSCKRIGEEFLGIKRTITGAGGGGSDDGTKMTTTTSSSVAAVAFPKLKRLRFVAMREWREWEEDILIRNPNDDIIHFKLFPCLDELLFWDCPKLKSLPQFIFSKSPIQLLGIDDCPILEERCRPETGGDWPKISHIPNIRVRNNHGRNTVFEIGDFDIRRRIRNGRLVN